MADAKRFTSKDVTRDPSVAKQARASHEFQLKKNLERQFLREGLSPKAAAAKALDEAARKMKTLAALHNPDMVAAGRDAIGDFGDRNVNSRIGSQWRSRVGALDEAVKKVPVSQRASAKMNVKLERCK